MGWKAFPDPVRIAASSRVQLIPAGDHVAVIENEVTVRITGPSDLSGDDGGNEGGTAGAFPSLENLGREGSFCIFGQRRHSS